MGFVQYKLQVIEQPLMQISRPTFEHENWSEANLLRETNGPQKSHKTKNSAWAFFFFYIDLWVFMCSHWFFFRNLFTAHIQLAVIQSKQTLLFSTNHEQEQVQNQLHLPASECFPPLAYVACFPALCTDNSFWNPILIGSLRSLRLFWSAGHCFCFGFVTEMWKLKFLEKRFPWKPGTKNNC